MWYIRTVLYKYSACVLVPVLVLVLVLVLVRYKYYRVAHISTGTCTFSSVQRYPVTQYVRTSYKLSHIFTVD